MDHNDCHNAPLSNEKLRQAVSTVIVETEEEERETKLNVNNVTMDTFIQSPVTTYTQRNKTDVPNERQISLDILAEMIKGFKGLTLQSTMNYSAYYHSDENDAKSDPKSDELVDTHSSDGKKRRVTDTDTTNGTSPHKLLINRLIPDIIPVVILPMNQTTVDGVAEIGGTLHAVRMILFKDIVVDAVCSAACVFKYPTVVQWKETDGTETLWEPPPD